MGTQGELPGVERPKVQEVEDRAAVYKKSRDARMAAGVAEKADKTALIDAMARNKLMTYRTDDGQIVSITSKSTVKLTDVGEAPGVGGDDEEDGDEEETTQ